MSTLTISEVQTKINDKNYWIEHCVNKLQTLSGNEKEYMYNHITTMRGHLEVLHSMKRIAQKNGGVSSERIYWEAPDHEEA